MIGADAYDDSTYRKSFRIVREGNFNLALDYQNQSLNKIKIMIGRNRNLTALETSQSLNSWNDHESFRDKKIVKQIPTFGKLFLNNLLFY